MQENLIQGSGQQRLLGLVTYGEKPLRCLLGDQMLNSASLNGVQYKSYKSLWMHPTLQQPINNLPMRIANQLPCSFHRILQSNTINILNSHFKILRGRLKAKKTTFHTNITEYMYFHFIFIIIAALVLSSIQSYICLFHFDTTWIVPIYQSLFLVQTVCHLRAALFNSPSQYWTHLFNQEGEFHKKKNKK